MIKEEAQKFKDIVRRASWERDDYPPYAIASWDDRNRYQGFIFKIIDELVENDTTDK